MIDKRADIPSSGSDAPRSPKKDYSGRRDGYGIIETLKPYASVYILVTVNARDMEGNILGWDHLPGSGVYMPDQLEKAKAKLVELAQTSGGAADRMRQAHLRHHLKLG